MALVLFLQEQTPEEIFRKIEQTIEESKTLTVKFRWEDVESGDGKDASVSVAIGTIQLGHDNKRRVDIRFLQVAGEVGDQTLTTISDGKKTWKRESVGKTWHVGEGTLNNTKRLFATMLTREGVIVSLFDPSHKSKTPYPISDIKASDDDKGVKALTYKVQRIGGSKDSLDEVRLSYDPKSYRLFKRVNKRVVDGKNKILTEVFNEFTFNDDISDDVFKGER